MATLVVAIPTVDGRAEDVARCERAYQETVPRAVRLVLDIQKNRPTCGEVWNEVARRARAFPALGEPVYLHCTADDLEPLPGWYDAAVTQVEAGNTPSALIWTAAPGQPERIESHGDWAVRFTEPTIVGMSRIPFCAVGQWIEIPPIHYFSDNAFSSAMAAQAIPIVADPAYAFRHHWAQAGRHPMNDAQWFAEQTAWQTWAMSLLPQPRYH